MRRHATLSSSRFATIQAQWHQRAAVWVALLFFSIYLLIFLPHVVVLGIWAAGLTVHYWLFARREAPAKIPVGIATLIGRDSLFDLERFLARTEDVFFRLEGAWNGKRLAEIRPWVSDGLFEQLSVQHELQEDASTGGPTSEILNKEIIYAAYDGRFDTLAVALQTKTFREVWSFLRSGRPKATTFESHCPNCGAPLEITDAAICGSCKSWIASGEFDWVACAIAESGFWNAPSERDISGLRELKARDPSFSVEFARDRAAVAFWRWQLAVSKGKPSIMRGISLSAVCDALAQEQQRPIRSPELVGIDVLSYSAQPEFDAIKVNLLWTGEGLSTRRRSIFTFVRRPGVKTDSHTGLCSAHCSKCGAAPSSQDSDRCEYCGHVSMPFT